MKPGEAQTGTASPMLGMRYPDESKAASVAGLFRFIRHAFAENILPAPS
jgi:hypothetical protein